MPTPKNNSLAANLNNEIQNNEILREKLTKLEQKFKKLWEEKNTSDQRMKQLAPSLEELLSFIEKAEEVPNILFKIGDKVADFFRKEMKRKSNTFLTQ